VWAALARPSTPDAALAPAPNDQSALSTSPSARKPSPERPGADQTNLHDQTKGLVLPESEPVVVSIPRIGVQSRLVELGLNADGAMCHKTLPSLAGTFQGPHLVHSGRPSSPGTPLGMALTLSFTAWALCDAANRDFENRATHPFG
jgi:hypothetical protein